MPIPKETFADTDPYRDDSETDLLAKLLLVTKGGGGVLAHVVTTGDQATSPAGGYWEIVIQPADGVTISSKTDQNHPAAGLISNDAHRNN